jgi:hypothetical protein
LSLDGSDDYICSDTNSDGTCDDNDNLDIVGPQTISAWVKTTDGSGLLAGKGSNSNFKLTIGLGGGLTGGSPAAYVSSGDATYNNSVKVNDGQWHHVVGVFIPSTSITLYVDGSQVAQDTSITTNVTNTSDPFALGYQLFLTNYPLAGQIDDVQVYNYALSADQIAKIYNANSAIQFSE